MFDVSLGELAVIGVVALVVIGPKKLPKVARTAGLLFGRAQRMAASFRADIERELHTAEMAELQKKMREEAANFRDDMAESAAHVSSAFSPQENRILAQPETPPAQEEPAQEIDPVPTKPRKRKLAEMQADLFAAPVLPAPDDAKDRR